MKKVILFNQDQIRQRVEALAHLITRDFVGEEVLVLGILKGAFIFMADLLRAMDHPVRYGFLWETMEENKIRFKGDLEIQDRSVILLKDVVHSGIVENYLVNQLKELKPRKLKLVALIDKPTERKLELSVDYTLFSVDEGVFAGYGMEYKGQFGNYPYIMRIEEDA